MPAVGVIDARTRARWWFNITHVDDTMDSLGQIAKPKSAHNPGTTIKGPTHTGQHARVPSGTASNKFVSRILAVNNFKQAVAMLKLN